MPHAARSGRLAAVVTGGLLTALAAAGCGSSGGGVSSAGSTSTAGAQSTTVSPSTAPASTTSTSSGGSFSANPLSPLGATQVTTTPDGHQLGLLVSHVYQPATYTGPGASPAVGGELVAVNLQLEADGAGASQHPVADLRVADLAGHAWPALPTSPAMANCTPLPAAVTVTAEQAPYGCAGFIVPAGTRIVRVTYTPDGAKAGTGPTWAVS